ncbi:class I SAM-dependent methyltransferase [Sporosarcina sp. A2]|uniref:class I SAM-dependent methyltransferase n=1 Tax=Sporosarcina sp. A2 TaxID=3393449 RepID=UPI003D7B81FB
MENTYLACLAAFGVGGAHPGGLQLTKKLLENITIDEKMTVLDAGCGTGQTAAYLVNTYNCQVLAVDYNPVMVSKAKERLTKLTKEIKIELFDIEKLPYEEESIDLVLSESVIAFTNPSVSIAELTRVLKKNGILIAIEMVLEHPLTDVVKEEITKFYGMEEIWTVKEWKKALLKTGLTIQSIEVPDLEADKADNETATDFSLSEWIDEGFHDILSQHLELTEIYKNRLGVRIFTCTK